MFKTHASLSIFRLRFVLFIFIFLLSARSTYAAIVSLSPTTATAFVGDEIIIDVRVATVGQAMNAVDIRGRITGNAVVASANPAGSILQIFIETPQATDSTFSFVGGIPNGFTGDGLVGRLIVRAVRPGTAVLSITPGSRILANTSNATALPIAVTSATLTVLPKPVGTLTFTSPTHPDQNQWYQAKTVELHWTPAVNTRYVYTTSRDQFATVNDTASKSTGDVSITGLTDGITYVAVKPLDGSTVSRYRLMIDTMAPTWSTARLSEGTPETDNAPFVSFLAVDQTSGVDRYEVQVDSRPSLVAVSPYLLPKEYTNVQLIAYDRAGNQSKIKLTTSTRPIRLVAIGFGLLAVVAVISLLIVLFKKKRSLAG